MAVAGAAVAIPVAVYLAGIWVLHDCASTDVRLRMSLGPIAIVGGVADAADAAAHLPDRCRRGRAPGGQDRPPHHSQQRLDMGSSASILRARSSPTLTARPRARHAWPSSWPPAVPAGLATPSISRASSWARCSLLASSTPARWERSDPDHRRRGHARRGVRLLGGVARAGAVVQGPGRPTAQAYAHFRSTA